MKPHHRAHAGGGHGIGGLEVHKNIKVHFSWKSGAIARMKCCFVRFSWDGRRTCPYHCHPSRRSEISLHTETLPLRRGGSPVLPSDKSRSPRPHPIYRQPQQQLGGRRDDSSNRIWEQLKATVIKPEPEHLSHSRRALNALLGT